MHRGSDCSGDPSGPAGSARSGGDGRFARGPSRWSGGGGGGGGDFGETDGGQRNRYGGGGGGGGRGDYSVYFPIQTHPDHDNRSGYVKLFVGTVPRIASEDDVRHLFEEHGDVLEVALIRDRKTGEQQECCLVKYATSEEAERAIRAFHNPYTIPGATGPVQVRYADGEKKRLGSIERKLFVAFLNKQATAKEIEEVLVSVLDLMQHLLSGRHMPPDTWHPSNPSSVAPHQFNNFGSDNPMDLMGGTVTSAADNGAFRPRMFPGNCQTAVPTSSHMGINPSSLQWHHLGGQQIPPLQKPPGPPHNFPVQLQN